MRVPPKNPVAVVWKLSTCVEAYKAAMEIHERAGQRMVTLLVFAAFIVHAHSDMVKCDPEETLDIVRGFIADLRARVKAGQA